MIGGTFCPQTNDGGFFLSSNCRCVCDASGLILFIIIVTMYFTNILNSIPKALNDEQTIIFTKNTEELGIALAMVSMMGVNSGVSMIELICANKLPPMRINHKFANWNNICQ